MNTYFYTFVHTFSTLRYAYFTYFLKSIWTHNINTVGWFSALIPTLMTIYEVGNSEIKYLMTFYNFICSNSAVHL